MKKIIILTTICLSFLLVSCASEDDRLAACTAKGVSIDTCYIIEKQQQRDNLKNLQNYSKSNQPIK